MRIGIDARCLEEEKISGVGEYALEIIRNLLEGERKIIIYFFQIPIRSQAKTLLFFKKYPNVRTEKIPLSQQTAQFLSLVF